MSPQRRIALVSVVAAVVLIGLKIAAGIQADSLGLLSEAAHSGTDLVAALLTFFAVGVAGRPADRSHPYGHGKAEHLGALAEAGILVVFALAIAAGALIRLIEGGGEVRATSGFRSPGIPRRMPGRPRKRIPRSSRWIRTARAEAAPCSFR